MNMNECRKKENLEKIDKSKRKVIKSAKNNKNRLCSKGLWRGLAGF